LNTGHSKAALHLATKAMNTIYAFNSTRIFSTENQPPPRSVLFHYTTAEGLKGIIEENYVRATSAYFLNDSTEITYGCKILARVLDEWETRHSLAQNSLSLGLLRELKQSFGEDLPRMNLIHPIYLACFCQDDNLLSQWRAYGQAGGYSLGFAIPSDVVVQGIKPEPDNYTAKWLKVEYDENEQAKKCQVILDAILPVLDDEGVANALRDIEPSPLLGYSNFRTALNDLLLDEIIGFKNQAFDVEREWRIVVRRRELLRQGTDDGGYTPPQVYFRASGGFLVPYVKLVPMAGKLPIACVRSGPTLDKTTAAFALRMFLDRNGFPATNIKGSEIPVRF
jgi:hypothetical protein